MPEPIQPGGNSCEIADQACMKHSGRVGRSASAKDLEESPVLLAVRAQIRRQETNYDELMNEGMPREIARERVRSDIDKVCCEWMNQP